MGGRVQQNESAGPGKPTVSNLRAIIAMMCATAIFTCGDASMKVVSGALPTGETIFVRALVSLVVLLCVAIGTGQIRNLRRSLVPALAWRCLGDTGGAVFFQAALGRMKLADIMGIIQLTPLSLTAASALFLGERVGWRRWTAVGVGFCGALLVIKPGSSAFNIAAIIALMAVLSGSLRDIATRKLDHAISPVLILLISQACIMTAGFGIGLAETWTAPSRMNLVNLILGIGMLDGRPDLFDLFGALGRAVGGGAIPLHGHAVGHPAGLWHLGRTARSADVRRHLRPGLRGPLYDLPRAISQASAGPRASERAAMKPPLESVIPAQRAIVATLAATAAFTISDTLMKLSSSGLPTGQTIALRGVFGTIAMTVLARALGGFRLDRRLLSPAVVLRTLCEVGSSIFFFLALYRMPIANAMAILQFLPLALTAASAIVLREAVGWRRWLATGAGLIGVLLIVRPGNTDYGWPSLLMLACVGCITVRDLATRRISAAVSSLSIGWLTAAAVTCGGVVLDPPWQWATPTPAAWAYLAGAALVTVAGNLLMIVSTRTAAVAVVAPFRYATVLFAILSGYLVWGEVPDRQTIAGIVDRHRRRPVYVSPGACAASRSRATVGAANQLQRPSTIWRDTSTRAGDGTMQLAAGMLLVSGECICRQDVSNSGASASTACGRVSRR